jgi:hypothetical protein
LLSSAAFLLFFLLARRRAANCPVREKTMKPGCGSAEYLVASAGWPGAGVR